MANMNDIMNGLNSSIEGEDGQALDYKQIDTLVGQTITIKTAKGFENGKGPGVTFTFDLDGHEYYTTTHAQSVTALLTRQEIQDVLANDTITTKVVKKRSQNNPDRWVFKLE